MQVLYMLYEVTRVERCRAEHHAKGRDLELVNDKTSLKLHLASDKLRPTTYITCYNGLGLCS